MRQQTTIDPEARLTPNQLSELLRELSGGRTPISPRRIRAAARAGELPTKKIGRWTWIRWADALVWLQGECSNPGRDSVEDRVNETIRRENALASSTS